MAEYEVNWEVVSQPIEANFIVKKYVESEHFIYDFTEDSWVADGDSFYLEIPKATHGFYHPSVVDVYILEDALLYRNAVADYTVSEYDSSIKLYSEEKINGRIVLTGKEA